MLLNLNGLSLILTTDCVGGVFTQTVALAKVLVARGARIIVATVGPQPRSDQVSELMASGAEWFPLSGTLDWMAESEKEIAETAEAIVTLAQSRRVTSVHLHAPAYAAFGFSYPHVVACHSCHGTWWRAMHPDKQLPADLAWHSRLTGLGLACADDVIAPSHSFAACLASCYALERIPVAIPNGAFAEGPAPTRPRMGAVALGRFWDEAKNIDALARIAPLLHAPLTAIGPLPGSWQSLSTLRTPGPQSRASVLQELANAQIFLSVARYEPFGLAALEAAQAGLALVLSDIPAHRENWDGVAIFRPVDDIDGIARIVNQLIACPEEAEERGRAARQRAQDFTPERMGEATALLHLHPRNKRIAA